MSSSSTSFKLFLELNKIDFVVFLKTYTKFVCKPITDIQGKYEISIYQDLGKN